MGHLWHHPTREVNYVIQTTSVTRWPRALSRVVQPAAFLAIVGVVAWCVAPLLLLVFPGILLATSSKNGTILLPDVGASIVFASITFWVLLFLPLHFTGLPLSRVAYAVVFGVSAVVVTWLSRRPVGFSADPENVVAAVVLGLAVALRLAHYWRGPLAPVGDMNMHCYLTALIVHADGVPSSQRPLLPIDHFGAYPPAFHALAGLSSLVSSLSPGDSTRLWVTLVFSLVTLALYTLLRLFFSPAPAALAAVLASFVPRQPQDQVGGGPVPTVLALVFVILVLAQLLRWVGRPSATTAAACAAFSAGSILSHLTIPVAIAVAAAPPVLWGLARSRFSLAGARAVAFSMLVATGVVAATLAPFFMLMLTNRVSDAEIDWIWAYQDGVIRSIFGEGGEGAIAYLGGNAVGWCALVLGAAGLITIVRRHLILGSASIMFAACVWVLVVHGRLWNLPLSAVLYPDRIALLLVIPLAIGLGVIADAALASARRRVVVWGVVVVVLGVAAVQGERYFGHTSMLDSRVRLDDLHAMRWISQQTEPDAIFRNRWEDAGLWIPCLAFRAVTNPHQSPFYFDEFRDGARALHPRYLYVSETARSAGRALEGIVGKPEIYRRVYERGSVRIFAVRESFDERAWLETLRAPADGSEETVQVTIATNQQHYRVDGHVRVSGGLQSTGAERFIDWHVVVRRIGGPLVYWVPLARGAWLHPEARLLQHPNYPMPDISLAGLRPGRYRIEMIVAEPYTREILGWTHTDFTIGS